MSTKSATSKSSSKPKKVKAPGAVAIQQAMVHGMKMTFRKAAGYSQVNPRTLGSHVAAKQGSNVTPWANRSAEEQAAAIAAAKAHVAKIEQAIGDVEAKHKI